MFGSRFIKQGTPAAIYNVGSENSLFIAVPKSVAYVASKHAVLGLSESLKDDSLTLFTSALSSQAS